MAQLSPESRAERPFICPHCKRPATAVIQGSAQWNGYDEDGDIVAPPSEWNLLQCSVCKMSSLELREDFSGEGFEQGAISYEYPAPRRLSYSVPNRLRLSWEEARRCFDANAYTAAVVMVRRTNVRRDAHHRGINDLEGENGERRTCWRRARMELGQRMRLLPPAAKTSLA